LLLFKARNKKNEANARTRTPSSIPATRTNWQPQPVTQQYPQSNIGEPYSPEFQRPVRQEYGYDPRLQPGYIQQPLVQQQPSYADYGGQKIRELQPEYVYQQVRIF
jgi:hypothetical protein